MKPNGLLVLLAAGMALNTCGKKNSTDSNDNSEKGQGVSATDPGVKKNTANSLKVKGKLNATSGLKLAAEGKKAIVLFTLNGFSQVKDKPTEISVKADGSFEVPIQRQDAKADEFKKILEGAKVNRDLAKKLFPQHASKIDSLSDEEIRTGLQKDIENAKNGGAYRYVLVSFDKSGDREAEAKSMQFIGLATGGESLKVLPAESLKGDINLGTISGKDDEATAELKAIDSLNLKEQAIKEMAGNSETLKILKNTWINPSDNVVITPWYGFKVSDKSEVTNGWANLDSAQFTGGGYYTQVRDLGATWGEICPPNPTNAADKTGTNYAATPQKTLQWIPPVDLAATSAGTIYGPKNPFTNVSASYKRQDQYGEIACSHDTMYTRAKLESDKSFQLQLGMNFGTTVPEGYWKLKLGDSTIGSWDIAAAKPVDSEGKPIIYLPSFRVNTDGSGIATSIQARFSFYDKASNKYLVVSDDAVLKTLVHSFNLEAGYPSGTHDGGDYTASGKDINFEKGIVSLNLSDAHKGQFPCPQNSDGIKCLRTIGMSYYVGPISYRMELR